MLLSKCVVCDSKKSKFIKEQEASGLLSSLGIKVPLNNFFFQILFCFKNIECMKQYRKMNEIVSFY